MPTACVQGELHPPPGPIDKASGKGRLSVGIGRAPVRTRRGTPDSWKNFPEAAFPVLSGTKYEIDER
jgi:hypothetical protein